MSPRRLATAICSLAALSLVATACGDDPADLGTGAGAPDRSESTLPSSEGSPTGDGILTIAGESFPFEADVCALTPVNHGARDYELYVHGTGGTGDAAYEVEVFRTASESGNVIETISFEPGDGQLAGGTHTISDTSEPALQVSSSLLSGEMDLVGTGDVPIGLGSVSVTCA